MPIKHSTNNSSQAGSFKRVQSQTEKKKTQPTFVPPDIGYAKTIVDGTRRKK